MKDKERICTLCPRQCGIDRSVGRGFCGEGDTVRIARYQKHEWEEPPISGTGGSGTVFFTGCTLKCVFCQNYEVSRGTGAAVDTEAHTIAWARPSDTFHKSITLDVKPSSAAQQQVTLERVATRLRLTLTDEVPADAASVTIAPERWYTGLDYLSGDPSAAVTNYTSTVALPESVRGTTGLQMSIFGLSSAAQWTTDVALTSTNADGALIGQGTIKSAPMRRNVITNCTGPLFSSVTVGGIVLNTEWLPEVEITW